jgi:hypothetical protein
LFNLNAILNIVGANTSSVKAAVADINSEMDRGTRKARSFADAVALKGSNLGVFAVASTAVIKLTESISMATRDALRFEVEMAKIAQTVGISNSEVRKHGEEIRKLSVLYGLSAPKIAETVRVLAQAGYTLRQAKEAADNLAQTTLLSSFESITDTTDGLIAVNKQFIDTIGKSAAVLSLFNVVSKKYAVESADLVEVVRKAGGTFSATGGKLEELLAVFTTVRDTTRESAETIAVGLRTIFTRLQRPKTIEYLQQFGVELVNLEGQFVGNFEAIQRIQRGLDAFGVRPGSIKFAEVVEEIGGVLQQSRVIPLLTQGAKLQQVYADAQSASSETAMDLAKAQDTLSFKIAQTQQNFSKLIGDIASSKGFDTLVRGVLSMTNAMIHFAAAIKDVLPLISALLAFNLAKSVGKLALGGPKAFLGKGFATGGFVPGSGSGDTVPAMLTPGEFVIRKSAAQAMGAEALHGINRYAGGGKALQASHLGKGQQFDITKGNKTYTGQGLDNFAIMLKAETNQKLKAGNAGVLGSDLRQEISNQNSSMLFGTQLKKIKTRGGAGNFLKGRKSEAYSLLDTHKEGLKAAILGSIKNTKTYNDPLTDILNALKQKIKEVDKTGQLMSGFEQVREVRLSDRGLRDNAEVFDETRNAGRTQVTVRNTKKSTLVPRFASGGSVGTDTVPSLLTPGEFVVNKKSAQAFGYGNLHKVNKYASGGTVGVQRFAGGGAVGGEMLPGLSGLGDLAIVVNQLIPAMASATASFAKISIAASITSSGLSSILNAGKGVSDFFTAYKAESKRLSEVREAEVAAYVEGNLKLKATRVELATARATALANPIGMNNSDRDAAEKAARLSVSRPSFGPGSEAPVLDRKGAAEAKAKIGQAIKDLTATYGAGSETVKRAIAIHKSLSANLKDQSDAVVKYTELALKANTVQQKLITALEEREAAELKARDEAGAKINTGGIRGKIGAGFRALTADGPEGSEAKAKGDALRAKVQAVIEKAQVAITIAAAYFASSARTAAQALDKLTNAAIEAGDAQGAYNNSIAASEKEAQAAGIDKGASGGAAIGGVLGLAVGGIVGMLFPPLLPLVSLFGALGSALGTGIGALLGFFGAVDYITDGLGLTDPAARQMEIERKASADRKSANIKNVEKTTSDSIAKSSNLRQFNPNAANDELVKGFNKLQNSSAAQSLGNPAIQEQSKQFYDQLASAFEQLRTSSKNAGKGFDQLKRENFGLVSALERSSASLADNDQAFKGLVANTDAVSTAVNRERQTKIAAINLQLRQLAIQKQVNTSLAHMDSVIKTQNEALMGFAAALGEDYSPPDIGVDLTDLSSRNTSNPDYARGLNAVSSSGGPFTEQANILGRAIPLLNNLQNSLTNQSSAEIGQSFDAAGVSPEVSKGIVSIIEDARSKATKDEPFNSTAVQQEIMDKAFKSLTDDVENTRKAINTQLQSQLSILKKQSELQKKQLEYRLAGLDAEREIADTIDKVRGTEADPRAERAARLNRAGTILQGTSLQGAPLAGDKSDIDKIGKALATADLRKQRIVGELQTVKDSDARTALDEEMVGLTKETERLNEAMSSLGDVSKENAAIEAKIAKNQEKRGVVREAASNLAFGSGQDRKDFFRTLNQARGVAAFGTADVLRDKDKGGVFSFLKQMKDIPAFNGKTGQEVIDATTRNYLQKGGVSQQKIEEIMLKMIPSEEQALKLMTDNMTIDVARNALLAKILVALGGDIGFMKNPGQIAQAAVGMSTGGPTNTIFKPRGTDTIPAMLTPGEYVVSAKNAKKNMGTLAAINSGKTKYLEIGGGSGVTGSGDLLGSGSPARRKKEEEDEARLAANREEYGQPFNNAQREEKRREFAAFQGKPVSDAQPQKASTTQPTIQPKKSQAKSIILPAYEGRDPSAPTAMQSYKTRLAAEGRAQVPDSHVDSPNFRKYQANLEKQNIENELKVGDERRAIKFPKKVQKQPEYTQKKAASKKEASSNVFNDPMMNGQRDLEYQKKLKDSGVVPLYDTPEAKAYSNLDKTTTPKEIAERPLKDNYVPSTRFSRSLEGRYAAQDKAQSAQFEQAATTAPTTPTSPVVKAKKPKSPKRAPVSPAVPEVPPEFASEYASHTPPAPKGPVFAPEAPGYVPPAAAAQPAQAAAVEQEVQSNGKRSGPRYDGRADNRYDGRSRNKTRLVDGKTYKQRMTESRERLDATAASTASGPQIPAAQQNGGQSNPVAMGGTVRQSQGQAQGQAPDFSSLMAAMKTFNTEFSSSVKILNDMPKIFKIDLSSQGINVNLNSAEFLAKVPNICKQAVMEEITAQMKVITEGVRNNLAGGVS